MEARLGHAGLMKRVLDAIKDLTVEGNFDCSASGMSLQYSCATSLRRELTRVQAMDSSHVSLVSLELKAEGFEHYNCERNLTLGLAFQSMAKVLKCADNDDVMSMKYESDADTCTFVFENEKMSKLSEFRLKLLQLSSEHLSIPDAEYAATVTMGASEVAKIWKDLAALGDTLRISVDKKGIQFAVSGDLGNGTVLVKKSGKSGADSCTIDYTEPVSSTYALRYLIAFTKATPLSEKVTLRVSSDIPLVVEYYIANGEGGSIRYYLAPKMEEA